MAEKKDTAVLKWICSVAGPGGKWVALLTLVRIAQGGLAIFYAYALRAVVNCATEGNRPGFLPALYQFTRQSPRKQAPLLSYLYQPRNA